MRSKLAIDMGTAILSDPASRSLCSHRQVLDLVVRFIGEGSGSSELAFNTHYNNWIENEQGDHRFGGDDRQR